MEHLYDYLIIGAGMTADAAAKAIRKADAEASIGMVGDERQAPYERPPLTKALWKGDKPVDSIDLGTDRSGAVLHLERRIEVLDRDDRSARDDHGDIYRYRRLLLATGATPRKLPFAGDRVINYRTLDNYLALRRYAVPGAKIAVVGGGFIGAEIAASLSAAGCQVTMMFPGASLGAGRFPAALAKFIDGYYREHGVTLMPGVKVVDGKADADGVEVALSDGTTCRADAVVAGLGVTPNTDLAERAGLRVDNGVVVDEHLRSSAPDVWAAGDVANAYHPFAGRHVRVEHWANALHQPVVAAQAMLGKDAVYDRLPYFFTDQYDLGMEYTGFGGGEVVVRGDEREFVAFWLRDGRLTAAMNVNVWTGVPEIARRLIRAGTRLDPAALADPAVPLEDMTA